MSEDKVLSPVERMTDVMARAAEAAEMAVAEHGDKAVDLALLAARVQAIQELVAGAGLLGLAWIAIRIGEWAWSFVGQMRNSEDVFSARLFACGFAGIAAGSLGVAGVVRLINIKAWVGAFVPEYWIAAKALESIL